MIPFPYKIQAQVLDQALKLTGYMPIADAALQVIDGDENLPSSSKTAIRAMAYWIPNHIQMTGGDIIQTIMTATWEEIGVVNAPTLVAEQRGAVLAVIMAVCKSIISIEATRLQDVADLNTDLPEGD